jgi:polysaccharide export outer membrane protein
MHRMIWLLSLFLSPGAHCLLGADQTPAPTEALAGYVLGPNDQITVSVVELPEFSGRSYRIDGDGTVSLPLLGRVHAAGLTLTQLENNLHDALLTQVRTPHVTANVAEARSQAVSVMGAVNTPGMQQIQGAKTLFDVLAAAGGLKPEAGQFVTITREASEGPLNLPNERKNLADGRSTADVEVRDIVELRNPRVNIVVRAHDEISVSRGMLLYVIGNVHKPGGFTLLQGHPVSALEALSMAEGFAPNASPAGARILRRTSEAEAREQIPIDLKKILAGKAKDMQLSPDDILYVPDNVARRAATKTLETALATLSGVVIWRGF